MRCTTCLEPVDPAVAKFCAKCGASLDTPVDPLVGQVIGGRYRVLHLLAEGGMGRVYAAEQTMGSSVRKVAIKVLLAEYSGRDQDVQRLARECSTVAELEHPNTIKFYDYGETREGDLFIAMEFLSGEPLAQIVKHGPLTPERVDLIVGQICGSLHEAHTRGIVHRDLKPDNIIVTSPGGAPDFVKVLDFGIAKRVGGRDPKLTPLGVVLGSPPYMSPEQFTMQDVDPRSDIYSLGVVAYQLLTAKLPFNASEPIEWAALHMGALPTPIDSHGVPIPPTMREAIHRALAKEPKDRPPSMRDFYAEFTIGLGTLEPGRLSSMLPAAASSLPFPPPPRAPSDLRGLAPKRSEPPPRKIPSTIPTAPQGSVRDASAPSGEPAIVSSPAATSQPPPSSEAPTRVRDEESVAAAAAQDASPRGSDPVVEVQAAAQAEVDAPATIRDAGPPVSDDGDAEARPVDAEPATTRDSEPTFEPSRSDGGADPSQHGVETAALRSKKGTLVMAASQPPPKPPMPDLIPPTIRDPSVALGARGSRRWLLFGALALVVAGAIASALTWFFYLRDAPKPKPKKPKPAASSAPPPG